MAFDTNNLLSQIKTTVYSSIRLGYQSACDYPVVLGAGILVLFLHKLFPSLFTFLLSSSPVFLLTALLLGTLLSYGEPSAPVIGKETFEKQQILSPKSNISITDYSIEEVENVDVKVHAAKRFESHAVYIEDRTSEGILHDTECDEENIISVSADTILCAESSEFSKSNTIVEREEYVKEICEKVELQEFESTNTERVHEEVKNQLQLGELMSTCWQPVPRQDPCSDSESDLTESSSDASITDIIPMLDELNPPANMGTSHPNPTFSGNLNSSSADDEDDSEEDGDLSSNDDGAEKKDDRNNWKHVNPLSPLDSEKNSNLESLMERRHAKNILKFELDKRLMDMQAADAIQKMEEVSRFRVQVPSISTPRRNPFDPSNGSEEIVLLPQIPDSAPSVLLPWRKPFDVPFDQIVDHDRQLPKTWTPRPYFPSTQHRKHGNLYVQQSTYLQHHNGVKQEKSELSGKDICDSHSDGDSEVAGNNGKLFGSLEAHIGEEIKILSAAISDACVLEVNDGINEGTKNTDSSDGTSSFYVQKSISSISETKDSVCAGSEQSVLCSLSEENNSEQHIVEADSISEVNSLFKCRMEEVLVQSISESSISQPLTVKLEDELSGMLSAGCGMPVIEASSVEELNSQFAQINEEELNSQCAQIQDRSSEALPAENSELPNEDGYSSDSTLDDPVDVKIEGKPKELLTEDAELPILEVSSVEQMNSLFKQVEEEVQAQMPQSSEDKFGQHKGETACGVLIPDDKI
ncbi:uncharacterized protein LOC133905288 isoform X2 [Phragmites australis]|nr:uncharacterized protein LOC133905288 isoform X2 [Phragmites australis]